MSIVVEGLTLRHVGRRAPAIRDLSLRWEDGERLLLLGPSGSGKSTLALCLNGVVPHSLEAHWEAGRVLVDGQDSRRADPAVLARRVGVLFQDPETQLVMLEVDDEIAFGLENLGQPRPEMRRRVEAARAMVGLDPRRTPRLLDALSGGTKQRVALAAVLVTGGAALVADEPTANLDPAGARLALNLLRKATRRDGGAGRSGGISGHENGRSLLLIEHRLDDLAGLIDRVAVLDESGHLALEGSPAQVFGAGAARLDALGVWTPQLFELGRLLGAPVRALPDTPSTAADLLVARWPAAGDGSALAVQAPHSAAHRAPARSAGDAVLSLRGVAYRYEGAAGPAVEEVTLDVGAGEFVALVGPNGAGKSTLGLLLAGVLRPTAGRVLLAGRDVATLPERDVRRRLSYVFQYPEHQFAGRTVRQDVLFGLLHLGVESGEASRRADAALERFGLAALAEASPYLLSHGQKRRLSVATALVLQPEVLILDEPTFGQDRRHASELLDLLAGLHRDGRTVVAISHDMTLVAERAQRVVAIAAGGVVFDGPPPALFDRPDVLRRCGLRRPPIADAVSRARARRADIPPAISLPAVRSAFSLAAPR